MSIYIKATAICEKCEKSIDVTLPCEILGELKIKSKCKFYQVKELEKWSTSSDYYGGKNLYCGVCVPRGY